MNSVQMNKLYKIIDKIDYQNKFVVFFGANKITELAIRYLEGKGKKIDAIIDNDITKSKTTKFGVKIDTPMNVLGEFREDAVIFIASRYVKEMTEQLQDMGYVVGINIFETIYTNCTLSDGEMNENISYILKGKKIYEQLNVGEKTKLLVCPYKGIGDVYFVGAYFEEYCKKEQIWEYILCVVGNICRRVAQMFGISNTIVLSQEDMNDFVKYIGFVGESQLNCRILNHNALHYSIFSTFEITNRLKWGEIFLCGIMEFKSIPDAAKPKKISINPDISIPKGKTVIMAPYANTVGNIEIEIWEKMVNKLKQKGYDVYTNSIGENEPAINGSKAISFSIEEAVSLVEYAGCFIALRSGLCDVISTAKARKIVLYPDRGAEFFNINKMGLSSDIKEYCVSGINGDDLVELVVKGLD